MAFWVVGGGSSLEGTGPATYFEGGKRALERLEHYAGGGQEGEGDDAPYTLAKRPRLNDWGAHAFEHRQEHTSSFIRPHLRAAVGSYSQDESIQVRNLAFLVIRQRSPTPEPDDRAAATAAKVKIASLGDSLKRGQRPAHSLERTASGLSISKDSTHDSDNDDGDDDDDDDDRKALASAHGRQRMLSDAQAASLVKQHVATYRRRCPDSQHQRILQTLINPRSRGADFPLDNEALRSIFSAANELFFANRLSQRVAWDWSHPASAQYESHIVGTTALRRSAALGGYETLIVLSSPILRDNKYNRRLLISTFLHEMIHSFLFVTTGLKARQCGGHTDGFHQIADVIDEWVGRDYLRLSSMDADLEHFRDEFGTVDLVQDATVTAVTAGPEAASSAPVYLSAQERHEAMYGDEFADAPSAIRHADREGWEWREEEGFVARDSRFMGDHHHVYS